MWHQACDTPCFATESGQGQHWAFQTGRHSSIMIHNYRADGKVVCQEEWVWYAACRHTDSGSPSAKYES